MITMTPSWQGLSWFCFESHGNSPDGPMSISDILYVIDDNVMGVWRFPLCHPLLDAFLDLSLLHRNICVQTSPERHIHPYLIPAGSSQHRESSRQDIRINICQTSLFLLCLQPMKWILGIHQECVIRARPEPWINNQIIAYFQFKACITGFYTLKTVGLN